MVFNLSMSSMPATSLRDRTGEGLRAVHHRSESGRTEERGLASDSEEEPDRSAGGRRGKI